MARFRQLLAMPLILSFAGCSAGLPSLHGGAFASLRARAVLPRGSLVLTRPLEDTRLLGKVLLEPYDPRLPLADQLSDNPCAAELVDVSRSRPEPAVFEDTEDLPAGQPALVPASSDRASSLLYFRLRLSKRLETVEGPGYAACCKERECGAGYLAALGLGEGEVASASATLPGGNADVAFDDRAEPLELSLGEPRPVRGFVMVTLSTDTTVAIGPPSSRPERHADAEYEANKVEVRVSKVNPDLFELCTKSACLTENQFVRRYAHKTGSTELDDFDRDRAGDVRGVGALMLVLGAVGTLGGAAAIAEAPKEKKVKDHDADLVVGGMGVGVGITAAAVGIGLIAAPGDGTSYDHFFTQSQARRFVARYNRALRTHGSPSRSPHERPPVTAPLDPPTGAPADTNVEPEDR